MKIMTAPLPKTTMKYTEVQFYGFLRGLVGGRWQRLEGVPSAGWPDCVATEDPPALRFFGKPSQGIFVELKCLPPEKTELRTAQYVFALNWGDHIPYLVVNREHENAPVNIWRHPFKAEPAKKRFHFLLEPCYLTLQTDRLHTWGREERAERAKKFWDFAYGR